MTENHDRERVVNGSRYAQQANTVWWITEEGEKVVVSDDVRSVADDPDGSDFLTCIDDFEEEMGHLVAGAFTEFFGGNENLTTHER